MKMIRSFRDVPIREKLVVVILLTSRLVVFGSVILFAVNEAILAGYASPKAGPGDTPLGDPRTGFRKVEPGALEMLRRGAHSSWDFRNIDAVSDIVIDGQRAGMVVPRSSFHQLAERMYRYVFLPALIPLGALLGAYLLSRRLAPVISGPIMDLARTMKIVPKDPPSTIDRTVLEGIRALDEPGGQGLLERIITLYLSDAPRLVEEVLSSAEKGEMESLLRAVHTLKSSSANVGATGFSDLCRKIEGVVRGGEPIVSGTPLLSEFEGEFRSVQEALAAVMEGTSA